MRINLEVPFRDKDRAKQLGARWHPEQKVWYLQDHPKPELFLEWTPKARSKHSRHQAGLMKAKAKLLSPKVTTSFAPNCGCVDVLPWEDCEHTFLATEVDEEAASRLSEIMAR